MESKDFKAYRNMLNKTPAQIASILGISVKAVYSYEQGWRSIPANVERQMLFFVTSVRDNGEKQRPCWEITKCPDFKKEQCPAWEFKVGSLCWFISGTICSGIVQKNWKEKIESCLSCEVLAPRLKPLKRPHAK